MRDCTKYAVMSTMLMLICTSPVYGTVRDNYLYFPIATNATLKDFNWLKKGHMITSGQTWEYIHAGTTSDPWGKMHVRAGRSGSTDVATWFKKFAWNILATHTGNGGDWPDKLNFAFRGDMLIYTTNGRKTACGDVVIGQGHDYSTGHNNWWIASEHMHEADGHYWLNCKPSADQLYYGYVGAVVLVSTDGSVDDGGYSINRFGLTLHISPPRVSTSLSSDVLWPANGKMHEIEATIFVEDACGVSPEVYLTSVESSEPDPDSGTDSADIQDMEIGKDDRVFKLRAERDNGGDGRVYTVTYDIIDGCKDLTTVQATVTVPHDKGKNRRPKKR